MSVGAQSIPHFRPIPCGTAAGLWYNALGRPTRPPRLGAVGGVLGAGDMFPLASQSNGRSGGARCRAVEGF